MSKTQLSGGRIRKKSLTFEHFVEGIKIPEANLLLQYPSHMHPNKDVIDRVRYTGSQENIDLRDLELLMIEIVAARRNGNNLGGTIDQKADRGEIDYVRNEVDYAKGDYETLSDAIRAYGISVDDKLLSHIGTVGHSDLDTMYADYIATKEGMPTLKARIDALGSGTGTGGGDIIINTLKPWTYRTTLEVDPDTGVVPRSITVPYTFVANTNAIQVYDGPLYMSPGASQDYVEHDDSSISFNYDIPAGSTITITGVSAGTFFVWRQVYRTTENQQIFTLLDDYNVGQDEIMVYESGMLMVKQVDYVEVDDHKISFTYPLPAGLDVVICRRR